MSVQNIQGVRKFIGSTYESIGRPLELNGTGRAISKRKAFNNLHVEGLFVCG